MTSQSNTPPPSLHFLLQRICSTALNSSTSTKRNELLQTIDQRLGLKHDDDCNDANNNDADGNSETAVEKTVVIKFASGGLGLKAAQWCTSKHAQKRLCTIIIRLLVTIATSPSHHNQQEPIDTSALLDGLIHTLSRILFLSHKDKLNEHLLDHSITTLDACVQQATSRRNRRTEHERSQSGQLEGTEIYLEILQALERRIEFHAGSDDDGVGVLEGCNGGEWAACLSLASHIHSTDKLPQSDEDASTTYHSKRLEQFILTILPSGTNRCFAPRYQIRLARKFFFTISALSFQSHLAPVLGRSLRANPESTMETACTVLEELNSRTIDVGGDLVEGGKLLASIVKQLGSEKWLMRELAGKALTKMAILDGGDGNGVSMKIVVEAVATVMKSATSLVSSDQRTVAHNVLTEIGITSHQQFDSKNGVISSYSTEFCDVSRTAMEASVAVLERVSNDSKETGIGALIVWLALFNKFAAKGGDAGDGVAGKKAVDYLLHPICNASKAGAAKEFRIRVGSLMTSPYSSGHSNSGEKNNHLVHNLVNKNNREKVVSGLKHLIDTASKKHAKSALVPQIDGLLAVHLLLLLDVKIPSSATGFLYSPAMGDSASTDAMVSKLIHCTIAMHAQLNSALISCSNGDDGGVSPAVKVLASCIVHSNVGDSEETSRVIATVRSVVDSSENKTAAKALVLALFDEVNKSTLCDTDIEDDSDIKGNSGRRQGIEGDGLVRRVASELAIKLDDWKSVAQALVLSHWGVRGEGNRSRKRRQCVLKGILKPILTVLAAKKEEDGTNRGAALISEFVSKCASSHSMVTADYRNTNDNNDQQVHLLSNAMHRATLSLITTLGTIAGEFDPESDDFDDENSNSDTEEYTASFGFAWNICVKELAVGLSSRLQGVMENIEMLVSSDVDLYRSAPGKIYCDSTQSSEDGLNTAGVGSGSGKPRENKNRADFEEDEWRRQVEKEIAEKKAKEEAKLLALTGGTPLLSKEDKELLDRQTKERERLRGILDNDYSRALACIEKLCLSELEVGNSCLSVLSDAVISVVVSDCAAFKLIPKKVDLGHHTLCVLASCVYEIDERYAPELAHAIYICNANHPSSSSKKGPKALPSPCSPAALVISQMDEYGDCLSKSSFSFLFPILHSALTGARTSPGCERALHVLHRHTDEEQMMVHCDDGGSGAMRKEMANAVLELLSHDRSLTFKDPTPTETLHQIYGTEGNDGAPHAIKSAHLAPLLGDRGAIGVRNCRIASMMTLNHVLSNYPRFKKANPLVENRIWTNCFAKDEQIRTEARKAWKSANAGADYDTEADGQADVENYVLHPPSKMYAMPLLPLLNHQDEDIKNAAGEAFAAAIAKHHDTMEKNLIRLLNVYIESYPTSFSNDENASNPKAEPTTTSTKGPAVGGKQKPAKTIGLSAPKKVVKKKPTNTSAIAMLTKKKKKPSRSKTGLSATFGVSKKTKERTFDNHVLAAQFESETSKTKKAEERDNPEKIVIRTGVLRVIIAMSQPSCGINFDLKLLQLLVGFLLAYGLADGNDEVRATARNTLRDLVATSGGTSQDIIDFLMPILEVSLRTGKVDKDCLGVLPSGKVLDDNRATDLRKEGVVIALGSAAIHLKDDGHNNKIEETINMLIAALSTPSQSVQSSVALCLSKLMKKGKTQERVGLIIEGLMKDCLQNKSLASRRGAAYGISAVVKGSGITTLKKFQIVKQLEEACVSELAISKEGALFAIELLSSRLGLLFEPYVIVLLPSLLKTFSDTSSHVRLAASSSIGLIMSKLSGHGVKLLMPAVISGLESEDWRTKQASIQMLGSMSHLAPKQLASCLPKAVPQLTEAFSDTHPKVKASAKESLEEISKVIRNPEISSIAPFLLHALTDPSNRTTPALEKLIETEFLHAIDAPSLALIVPVLHRGLRDRAANTKRFGALIAGNICTMINDPRDFVPYLPTLLPDLKLVLVDPIPDCRSTAAKALGSLTRSLGEATFPELRPWLIDTLKNEKGSPVERSGAAQGLTEVLCAGGANVVESVMRDEILPLISHPKAGTREGVLWVLTFLPSALGHAFASLITVSFSALISGLSDDNEPVRDVAMRAGRVMIRSNGRAHVDKILPSLEAGLSNDDYRIRIASLNLLGDLLGMIGGTKISKGDGDTQDDIRQAERAQAQIALVLGSDTRKRVLSSLYFRRSDSAAVVRQHAVRVWKTVVSATPRTLREIVDDLVGQIIASLASGHEENTQVAARCLGDVVGKLGDMVLPIIIPVLRDALYRGNANIRLGACVGLTEVIGCSSKEQIIKYLEILVKVVQDALCDEVEAVQTMAASCFQSLYTVVGSRAFDLVVPALLAAMENGADDELARSRAITGLTGILQIRSRELLPYLIPRMLRKPMTKNQASALSSICTVTGGSIHSFFSTIIPTLVTELSEFCNMECDANDSIREKALRDCVRVLCRSVDESGVNTLVCEIVSKCNGDKVSMKKESCWMLQVIAEERKEKSDFYEQVPLMYRELIHRLNDDSTVVLKAANSALSALSKNVPAEELVRHIEFIRNLVASMVSEARRRKGGVGDGEFFLPGFNIPKGLEPLLPIYQRGILYGNATIREVAAAGLGELIVLTANKFLAGPFIIKLTGPLLRIVGDRNPSAVKIAIIETLGLILTKGGPALRAFVPQFQTTFFKALSDPSRQVRLGAIKALALLMPLSTRLDPLIKELVSGALGNGSTSSLESAGLVAVQTSMLEALATVLKHGGKKVKLPESIPSALDAAKEMLEHDKETVREGASKVIGIVCALLETNVANEVAREFTVSSESLTVNEKHGRICTYRRILEHSAGKDLDEEILETVKEAIKTYMFDETTAVRESACVAIGAVLGAACDTDACMKDIEHLILKCMVVSESMEVLRSMAKGLSISVLMKPDIFNGKKGLSILDAALKNAMSGNQRVQLAYHDFLWLALNVSDGDDGLIQYSKEAMFENSKKMKALHTRVLLRIKSVELDD